MKRLIASWFLLASLSAICVTAADWPEWRGLNRSAKVTDFKAPETWPNALTPAWRVVVGEGDSSPSLVGDRLYVFSRQDGQEVIRSLNANNGEEIWQDKYASEGAGGGAMREHSGPRASPTVADGKVVTFGVQGMLSCLDAESGKLLWRKDDFEAWPMFNTASSPLIVDGLCIGQFGGSENGAVVAYELASGEEKWKWAGGSPSHASPVLMTLDGRKLVVAQVTGKLVALDAKNGELAWETANGSAGGPGGRGGFGPGGGRRRGPEGAGERRGPGPDAQSNAGAASQRDGTGVFAQQQPDQGRGQRGPGGRGRGGFGRGGRGGGRDRFATTPIVDGATIVFAGPGGTIKAVKLERDGDKIAHKELWTNSENGLSFNTPILKDGLLFGITSGEQLFCIDAQTGKSAWKAERDAGGGFGGYGSIVDAGSVLLAITPKAELIAFKPTATEYSELARIKVSDARTFGHLVVSGNRLFVKDLDSVAMFTLD